MKDALDALLDEAMDYASRHRTKALPSKFERRAAIRESFNKMYTNPENWNRTRGIALIHVSKDQTKTLLGNFSEYVFKNSPTRKLCRDANPIEVSGEEYVTGEWWLQYKVNPQLLGNMFEVREITFDLELGELQVFAHEVKIQVYLHQNWIAKVVLVSQTSFVCPTNKIFMYFPADLDVLGGMSFENKVALKTKLGV